MIEVRFGMLFPVSFTPAGAPCSSMNGLFSFDIDAGHFARQLRLDADRAAIGALGRRCADYLRLATGQRFDGQEAPRILLGKLRPSRVPVEQSAVFGIYARPPAGIDHPWLAGVLYFLHPPAKCDPWFIPLLLLEPAARGRGLGAAVHRAFSGWAAARGAARIVVAVANNNPRAWRFWRDRMGYQETGTGAWSHPGTGTKHRELTRSLHEAAAVAPWHGLTVNGGGCGPG